VRKEETLEVDLWALAQYNPTRIEFGIRPAAKKLPAFDKTEVVIDAPYWKNYRFTLKATEDDEEAEFFIRVIELGLVWFDQIHLRPAGKFLRDDVIAAIRSMRPPVLRFPGGCESTVYRWRNGTGPAHLRPPVHDPVFKNRLNYDFGTDEYFQLCHDLGAIPHISVAVGSGTPDEAGEWAAHCAEWFRKRGSEPAFMYWHIGNEHYGMWELGHMSAPMYAHVLKEFAPRIRRAYPNCRIIAQGPPKAYSPWPEREEWRKTILAQAGDCFDVMALQMYGVASGWPTNRDEFAKKMYAEIEEKAQLVRDAIRECAAASPGKTVAVTEWNL
jgi:alpha-N-arabinofuranosidase